MKSVIQPLPWWRLPFANALALHGLVLRQCQLCHVNFCHSVAINDMKTGCHSHWFNRLQFICADCQTSINWCDANFFIDTANNAIQGVAAVNYTFPFDKVMREFKNSQNLTSMLVLVHVLRQLLPPSNVSPNNSVIIPVPTTIERIRERGFSPLWWLTLYLSFHWQIPIFNELYRENRAHQQGLSREERFENLKQSFYLTEYPKVKNLILFDDVVTTGATMGEILKTVQTLSNSRHYTRPYNWYTAALLHGK